MSNGNARLMSHLTWATAALAACAVATGCSSNQGSAGGTATSASTSTSSAGATGAASAPASRMTHSLVPVPTTPVAAPSGGSVKQTVTATTPSALPSVALTAPATVGDLQVKLSVKRQTISTVQPGDTAGPALVVTATVTNKGSKPVSTSGLQVNVVDAANSPQTPMTSAPAQPMAASTAPGQTQTGVYVFHLRSPKQPVTATVWVGEGLPTATFVGTV